MAHANTRFSKTNAVLKAAFVFSLLTAIPTAGAARNVDPNYTALARTAQAELSRLGCYRMKVDGQWGRGSREALAIYYSNTYSRNAGLHPTEQLVARLGREEAPVCADRSYRSIRSMRNDAESKAIEVRLLKSLLNPGSF